MRESNFNYPAQNRACVCISNALYDRRAIDAPSPSLPLVNSLTHLSYLTATSPRIREILSVDGGLERLVRILKGCATGGGPQIDESLSQLKGKGTTLAKGARKSPFKPFNEYRQTTDENEIHLDVDGSLVFPVPRPLSLAPTFPVPSSTSSSKSKHLLYTYTLAFQCVVNIGVRGSETIRTRVVEAGALDVVVHVLERYLEEVARRKQQAEIAAREEEEQHSSSQIMEIVSSTATVVESRVPSSTAITSLHSSSYLAPPTRVDTPDTIVSMDEGSMAGDETGSSSGQEADGDDALSSQEDPQRMMTSSSKGVDRDGDVEMDGETPGAQDAPRVPPAPERERERSSSRRHRSTPTPPSAAAPPPPTDGLQYRDEDVLLSLQLLAYLSKYPHVRSVFHSPSEGLDHAGRHSHDDDDDDVDDCDGHSHDKPSGASSSHAHSHAHSHSHPHASHAHPDSKLFIPSSSPSPTLSSNVFSLVEAFTHRPPNNDPFTPRHSNEVQYWAGVIMRNACRKDESRGGIRQCANMQCGVWEKYAREFAKCRRCRKAKYCSKQCQSKAWQFGHRYWCAKAAPKDDGSSSMGGDEERRERRGAGGSETSGRRSAGAARRSDDDDELDDLPPPPPAAVASTSPLAHGGVGVGVNGGMIDPGLNVLQQQAQGPLSPPTIPAVRVPTTGGGGGGGPTHHHRHSRIQDTFPDVAGLRGADGMPLGHHHHMDENEVAQEMMGGVGVFGEMRTGGGDV